MKTLFSVGDTVGNVADEYGFRRGIEWRGDWCKPHYYPYYEAEVEEEKLSYMDLFGEEEDDDDDAKQVNLVGTVTEVVLWQEQSLNGIRTEPYYKTTHNGDKYVRQDLLEGVGEAHPRSVEVPGTKYPCGSFWLIQFEVDTNQMEEEVNITPGVPRDALPMRDYVTSSKNGILRGEMAFAVEGIWIKENCMIHEITSFDRVVNTKLITNRNGDGQLVYTGDALVAFPQVTGDGTECPKIFKAADFFKNLKVVYIEEIDSDWM